MKKTFDDGSWLWEYECKYVIPTNEPNDWYYNIAFETPEGGYLSNEEISCYYWNSKNLLEICRDRSKLKFYVENFQDIKVILKPLVKAHKAKPYKIYESVTSLRRNKLNKINKKCH